MFLKIAGQLRELGTAISFLCPSHTDPRNLDVFFAKHTDLLKLNYILIDNY